jgi:hypothetical protein
MKEQHMEKTTPLPQTPDTDARNHTIRELADKIAHLQQVAAERRTEAIWHRQAAQVKELWSEHCTEMAALYRQMFDRVSGLPELPAPGDIAAWPWGLGMQVGRSLYGPPPDATPEEIAAHRETMRALNDVSFEEIKRASDVLRESQSAGEVAAEEVPQPDPLTATPAEETGGLPVVPARVRLREQGGRYVRDPDHRPAVADGLPQRVRGTALDQLQAEHPKPPRVDDSCATPSCGRPIRGGADGWEHVDTGQRLCDAGDLLGPVASPASLAERLEPDPAQTRVDELREDRTDAFVQAVTAEHQPANGTEGGADHG